MVNKERFFRDVKIGNTVWIQPPIRFPGKDGIEDLDTVVIKEMLDEGVFVLKTDSQWGNQPIWVDFTHIVNYYVLDSTEHKAPFADDIQKICDQVEEDHPIEMLSLAMLRKISRNDSPGVKKRAEAIWDSSEKAKDAYSIDENIRKCTRAINEYGEYASLKILRGYNRFKYGQLRKESEKITQALQDFTAANYHRGAYFCRKEDHPGDEIRELIRCLMTEQPLDPDLLYTCIKKADPDLRKQIVGYLKTAGFTDEESLEAIHQAALYLVYTDRKNEFRLPDESELFSERNVKYILDFIPETEKSALTEAVCPPKPAEPPEPAPEKSEPKETPKEAEKEGYPRDTPYTGYIRFVMKNKSGFIALDRDCNFLEEGDLFFHITYIKNERLRQVLSSKIEQLADSISSSVRFMPDEIRVSFYLYKNTYTDNSLCAGALEWINEPAAQENAPEEAHGTIPYRELTDLWTDKLPKKVQKGARRIVTIPEGSGRTEILQETVNLAPKLRTDEAEFAGAEWSVGFINLATTHSGVIYFNYINKRYPELQNTPVSETNPVLFDPSRANILGLTSTRFKTSKITYCVRFVKKGTVLNEATGEEQPTIDYQYPIQILEEFEKSSYARIVLTPDNVLQCQRVISTGNVISRPDEKKIFHEIQGESIFLILNGGERVFDTIQSAEDDALVLQTNGRIINSRIIAKYRFGVITDFNEDNNLGEINGTTVFSLNLLEKAAYNIVKNQTGGSVRLHVIYRYDNEAITEIFSYTEDVKRLCRTSMGIEKQGQIINEVKNSIQWMQGTVTGIDAVNRELTIDNSSHHFVTVRSDAQTSIRYRNASIMDDDVFFKAVSHPFCQEGSSEPELFSSAFDVVCVREAVMLRFLPSGNQFFGYRNQTDYFPVRGNDELCSRLQDQEVEIEWRPDESSIRLEARISGDEFDDAGQHENDEDLYITEDIRQHPLFRYWRSQVQLPNLRILSGRVDLDEAGLPMNKPMVEQAIRILYGRPPVRRARKYDFRNIALIHLALLYPDAVIPEVSESDRDVWINRTIHSMFRFKAQSAPDISHLSFGEANYYLSVLIANASHDQTGMRRNLWSWELCLYRLFASDFLDPLVLRDVYNSRNGIAESATWQQLFTGGDTLDERHLQNLISQILLLDNGSAEVVSLSLHDNPELQWQLDTYINKYSLRTGFSNDIVSAMREKYREFRRTNEARIHAILSSTGADCIRDMFVWLSDLQTAFIHMFCAEDASRFKDLRDLCARFSRFNYNYIGFREQNRELREIERLLAELDKSISDHPCRDSFEMLYMIRNTRQENLLSRFQNEVENTLKMLYKDSRPSVMIEPIVDSVVHGEQTMQLVVSNNKDRQRNCQPAINIRVQLESLTEGIQAGEATLIDRTVLNSGEIAELQVPFFVNIDQALATNIVFRIQWKVQYDYEGDVEKTTRYIQSSDEGVFDLQLTEGTIHTKIADGDNPYAKAAKGDPLTAEDVVFVGRTKELGSIEETIQQDENGDPHFVQGATVILYGQRKCGKTSLINKLIGDISSNASLRERAILIEFTDFATSMGQIISLAKFRKTQYRTILQKFRDEVKINHPTLWAELEQNDMIPPDMRGIYKLSEDELTDYFIEYFTRFKTWDRGRHAVIILADEYSRLPVRILELKKIDERYFILNQLVDIPSFVRRFSIELGFIQVFIGHDSMIRSLAELGTWNHTAEFAKVIELAELKDPEARELITKPILIKQGYDAYNSPLGEQAIRNLCDLSGNKPLFLMRLCDKIYHDFIHTQGEWISERNVKRAVDALLDENDPKLFDILFTEDNDETGITEERETYRFLESAASCALQSANRRSADESVILADIRNRYGDDYADRYFTRVRNLLEARRVITVNNGQITIKSRLFLEYIKRRDG